MELQVDLWVAVLGIIATALSVWYMLRPKPRHLSPPAVNFSDYTLAPSITYASADLVNYTPIPGALCEYIAEQGWKILEVCAGKGANARRLRSYAIDVLAYDMVPNEEDSEQQVLSALTGTFEHQHPDRTLLACCGVEMKKCLANYTGNVAILGGSMREVSGKEQEVHLIRDSTNMKDIISYVNVDTSHKPRPENSVYCLDMRPSFSWMVSRGWILGDSFVGEHQRSSKWTDPKTLFQLWKRESVLVSNAPGEQDSK